MRPSYWFIVKKRLGSRIEEQGYIHFESTSPDQYLVMAAVEIEQVQSENVDARSPHPELPAPPDPAEDRGVVPSINAAPADDGPVPEHIDVFKLAPVAALSLLSQNVDALVNFTGDIPPTPPLSTSNSPHSSPMPARTAWDSSKIRRMSGIGPPSSHTGEHIDGVPLKAPAIGSPEAHQSEPVHIIGDNSAPLHIQQGAIARKFYSKKPPPISTKDYLLRLHRYCPMSTAVYLAASLYINRLAVVDKLLSVTLRNVHRLLLAALRVAMKALEDLRYAHSRFAKVGGVSELELGRLEISFCYLTSFDLKVDELMLQKEAESIKDNRFGVATTASFDPKLPIGKQRKKFSDVVTHSPAEATSVTV